MKKKETLQEKLDFFLKQSTKTFWTNVALGILLTVGTALFWIYEVRGITSTKEIQYYLMPLLSIGSFAFTVNTIILFIKGTKYIRQLKSSNEPFFKQLENELNEEDILVFELSPNYQRFKQPFFFYITKSFLLFIDSYETTFLPILKSQLEKVEIARYKNVIEENKPHKWWLKIEYLDEKLQLKSKLINFKFLGKEFELIREIRNSAKQIEIGKVKLIKGEDIHYLSDILGKNFEEEYVKEFGLDKKDLLITKDLFNRLTQEAIEIMKKRGINPDFSEESIKLLEDYLSYMYKQKKKDYSDEKIINHFANIFGAYIGMTLIKNLGRGKWVYYKEQEKLKGYGVEIDDDIIFFPAKIRERFMDSSGENIWLFYKSVYERKK